MANIKINNLNPAGSELFADSESFMSELSDAELMVQGGRDAETASYFYLILSVSLVTLL